MDFFIESLTVWSIDWFPPGQSCNFLNLDLFEKFPSDISNVHTVRWPYPSKLGAYLSWDVSRRSTILQIRVLNAISPLNLLTKSSSGWSNIGQWGCPCHLLPLAILGNVNAVLPFGDDLLTKVLFLWRYWNSRKTIKFRFEHYRQ